MMPSDQVNAMMMLPGDKLSALPHEVLSTPKTGRSVPARDISGCKNTRGGGASAPPQRYVLSSTSRQGFLPGPSEQPEDQQA